MMLGTLQPKTWKNIDNTYPAYGLASRIFGWRDATMDDPYWTVKPAGSNAIVVERHGVYQLNIFGAVLIWGAVLTLAGVGVSAIMQKRRRQQQRAG